MFTLPGVDTQTVDGTPELSADSIEGTFIPRGDTDTGHVVLIGREEHDGLHFDTFHRVVFQQTAEDAKFTPETPAQ